MLKLVLTFGEDSQIRSKACRILRELRQIPDSSCEKLMLSLTYRISVVFFADTTLSCCLAQPQNLVELQSLPQLSYCSDVQLCPNDLG